MNRLEAVSLVEFNHRANRRLLRKASRLPIPALCPRGFLSYPSILVSLVHILATQWHSREAAQSRAVPVMTLSARDFPTTEAPRRRWDSGDRAPLRFVPRLSDGERSGSVRYGWPRARLRSRRLSQILMHIVIHVTQHRSESAISLTSRDLSPGSLDFIRYIAGGRGANARMSTRVLWPIRRMTNPPLVPRRQATHGLHRSDSSIWGLSRPGLTAQVGHAEDAYVAAASMQAAHE